MNRFCLSAAWLVFALPWCVGCGQSATVSPTVVASATIPAASDEQPMVAEGSTTAATATPKAEAAPAKAVRPGEKLPVREITFDNIKLAMNKEDKFQRSLITPVIEKLSGTPVRIRGWIHPNSVFQQTGITQFVLVRDNQECCFGPGAAIFDCIMVEMTPGNTADFTTRPIAVEGTFTIREVTSPWGALVAIYHLDADGAK
jgi:hypothetical protein